MRGAILLLIALGLFGCKSQAPMADPFSNHPIVPPPGTGACPVPSADPGYAPSMSRAQPQPLPGTPTPTYSNAGSAPAGTVGGAWNAAGSTNQKQLAPSALAPPAGSTPGNGLPNPSNPGSPVNANPVGGSPGYGMPNYGNPSSITTPGSTPGSGYPASGMATPTLIPPPGTAAPGGYSNVAANPPPATPGPGVSAPAADNRYGLPSSVNNPRNMPTTPTSPTTPILGTPRPTPTRAASSIARPAAAIPNNAPLDYRSPRPVDDTAQPIRSPSTPYSNVPANSTTMNSTPVTNRAVPSSVLAAQPGLAGMPVSQPRTMPMAPTAYGSPLAAPPYRASIQMIEPDWQPCDGYADEGE